MTWAALSKIKKSIFIRDKNGDPSENPSVAMQYSAVTNNRHNVQTNNFVPSTSNTTPDNNNVNNNEQCSPPNIITQPVPNVGSSSQAVTERAQGWQVAGRNRRNGRDPQRRNGSSRIVGSRQVVGSGLSSAPLRDLDIFIGGCHLDSTEDEIKEICQTANVGVKALINLPTKSTWYKSYKLTVQHGDREKVLVPDVWPHGIFVRKFFFSRA